MTRMHITRQLMAIAAFAASIAPASAVDGPSRPDDRGKKVVLLELFTSQGCDSCPSAERLLGELASMGYGPDRVVPVAFHVDYFNTPWKDPFSDPLFSRREYHYSTIYDRENDLKNPNYLYLTPLMMIDGRSPMLGCDDAGRNHKAKVKIRELLDEALREPAPISLSAKLGGVPTDSRRSVDVDILTLSPDLAGRAALVEIVTVEDGVSTAVRSGENGGRNYLSHSAARSLSAEPRKLPPSGKSLRVSLPVTLRSGADAAKSSLAVFVQDEATGRVYQAASIPWSPKAAAR